MSFLNLVILQGGSEHQKPKCELMFDFTFSSRIPKKTTKTSFLRSSLIPEWMELGIFLLKNDFSGEVIPREVVRMKSKIEVKSNSKKCLPRQLGSW